MLPFGGQGANQAIEDGGALGLLLQDIARPSNLQTRLGLFEKIRKNRASRVQILSNVRRGNEKQVENEIQKYMEPNIPGKVLLHGQTVLRVLTLLF